MEEVRIFMDVFTNKDLYAGNLKIQGSNDFASGTIEDLVVIGEELYEGWNNYELNSATYERFRIFNSVSNGCDNIGEIKFFGQKVIDTIDAMVTLDVEIREVKNQIAYP